MYVSKKVLVSFVICIELILIMWLGYHAIYAYRTSLEERAVVPIGAEHMASPLIEGVEHFYRPVPNRTFTQDDPWLSQPAEQHITKQRFNDRYTYSINKEKDSKRVMALGDSFTYGLYVDTKDSYPEQLEDMLRDTCSDTIEVINAGVPGYDVEYTTAFYQTHGSSFDPDVVLWMPRDGLRKVNEVLLPHVKRCRANDMDASVRRESGTVTHRCSNESAELFYKEWNEADILAYQDTHVSKLLSDTERRYVIVGFSEYVPNGIRDYLRTKATEYDHVDYIELSVPIKPGNAYTLPDGHPSTYGHKMIAQELTAYLLDKNLVSCVPRT